MIFQIDLLPPQTLVQVNTDSGRYYRLPDTGEEFDSVTTILSRCPIKAGKIAEWQRRIGDEEAEGIRNFSTSRGNHFHRICEKYVLNDPTYDQNASPVQLVTFNKIKPALDRNITRVLGVELSLFSRKLKAAGTTDLFCLWGNMPMVIDYKTSSKPKREAHIGHYFVQAAAYAVMIHELHGIVVPEFMIIVNSDYDAPQYFRKSVKDFLPEVREMFIGNRNETRT